MASEILSSDERAVGSPHRMNAQSRSVSLGLIQVGTEPLGVVPNRSLLASKAEEAFRSGADIVILPEMSSTGYSTQKSDLSRVAEDVNGPTTSSWRDLAATYDGYVVGGFCEVSGGALFNAAAIVGPKGVVLHYRKLHLFSEEKNVFAKGNLGLPIVRTPFGVLGLCVCYDLRFLEVARALALMDVELLCVPTAWLAGFDSEKWDRTDMCPQAQGAALQANLNQMFIACASQVGIRDAHEFLGSSVIADPFGDLVAGPLSITEDQSTVVTVDLEQVKHAQRRGPLIMPREDRRTDVYGLSIEGRIL